MKTVSNFRFIAGFTAAFTLVCSLFLSSCQKDDSLINSDLRTENESSQVTDRTAPPVFIYGVTVYTTVAPSQIVRMDAASGAVIGTVNVTTPLGMVLGDIKGIFNMVGNYYVSTGASITMPLPYRNRILQVDPNTGVVIANTAGTGALVLSDDCYAPIMPNTLYSLRNNSNNLVETNTTTWTTVTYPLVLAPGYTARGLTFAYDPATGVYELLVVAAHPSNSIKMYSINLTTRAAIFIRDILPAPEFQNAHCGAGYFGFGNHIAINRNLTCAAGSGLNDLPYPMLPLFPHPSVPWGGAGFNFEDLCTMF